MVIAIIFVILGLVFAIVAARSEVLVRIGALLIWVGSLIAVVSFFFLPWVELGPPGTIYKNAGWLAQQTLVIETLKQIPGLDQTLVGARALNAQDVLNAFTYPIKAHLFEIAEKGDIINGWLVIELLLETDFLNAFLIIFPLFIVAVGLVIGALGLLGKQILKPLLIGLTVGGTLSFLGVLLSLPQLDTFGNNQEIILRLLVTLMEARVGVGGGSFALGLLLIAVGCILSVNFQPNHLVEENFPYDF